MFGVGVTLVATGYYRYINPDVPHPLWGVPCFLLAAGCFVLAWHLAKHAYLILTPLGVEVFPFFRPSKGMRLVLWQEIFDAEVDAGEKWLTLHFDAEKTSGIHLSMRPIRRNVRSLLANAVLGRISRREL